MLTWPLALHLTDRTVGISNVDQFDTAWLRLATADRLFFGQSDVFFPTGYPLGALTPNVLDHVLGAPLAFLLPWPLSDNLWWLIVLAGNGLAAHHLGHQVGGDHRAGALAGVLFLCAEPVLREANLSHAPQTLLWWSPLYVGALLRIVGNPRWKDGLWLGLWMALSALTYWYQALFLSVLSLPIAAYALLRRDADRRATLLALAAGAGLCLLLAALPLALSLRQWSSLAMTDPTKLPELILDPAAEALPRAHRWMFAQAGDVLWPLRSLPADRSNRLGLVLLGAAILGARARPGWWPFVVVAGVAGLLIMGPFLKVGEGPVLIGGYAIPLPGWLLSLSSFLGRLHWPQRWGILVPLALIPLAVRAPKPAYWAAAAVVEALLLSANAPLTTTPTAAFSGWRALSAAPGAVLVLPVDRGGIAGPSFAFAYRTAARPFGVNPFVPPGAPSPAPWKRWRARSPFLQWVDAEGLSPRPGAPRPSTGQPGPLPGNAIEALRADGFSAIALDATPGGPLSAGDLAEARRVLEPALGVPVDYGSVVVWWIDPVVTPPAGVSDGDAWRAAMGENLEASTPTPPPTTFPPYTWSY